MIEAELFVGEGGPLFWAKIERAERRFSLSPDGESEASLGGSVVAKGLSEAMRLVGNEGTHWRAWPKEGRCC